MDKATPTPASVDSVMAKAMMLVGALGDSCEAVTSLPFLEAVTALREEADRLAAQAAPTGLTDMGWVIDAANEGELAAYDQGCAECQQAVAKILDGKDTGDGTANPPWELLRRRLIALVAAQPSQAPVVQAGEYPPLPEDLFSEFWGRVAVWDLSAEGEDAGAEAIRIENVVKGLMRAYVDADRAARQALRAHKGRRPKAPIDAGI